jgi:RHS repeat-associated protein
MLAEYVYLGDQLFAMIKPGEQAYYYHNDHLGTPQVLTSDSQVVAWKAAYTPFGEAVISISAVENPFRFPGQYYDSETGLHYNYYRYYNPPIGRYLTPDPIGLLGGINLFVYTGNSPINRVDPNGLASAIVERIEDVETVGKLVDLIQKSNTHSGTDLTKLLPNPSTSMTRLLDAMSKPGPCQRMLLAKTCEEFKSNHQACWEDLFFKYLILTKHGMDVQGALTETLFERIVETKKNKVCCKK